MAEVGGVADPTRRWPQREVAGGRARNRSPTGCARRVQAQTGLMRVVVSQIDADGTMWRRMVETAGRSDFGLLQELIARALAVPLPYRPVPGGPIYHLRMDDRYVMVAEDDLAGPLFDLVTAVLAKGDAV